MQELGNFTPGGWLDREKRRDLIRDSDRFRSIIDYDLVSALVSLSLSRSMFLIF